MKKTIKSLLFFCLLIQLTAFINPKSTKPFEGIINFSLSFEGLSPEIESMMAGSEMKVYIKKEKSKTDMNMAVSHTTVITDSKTKQAITLMDMMGQKIMMKFNTDSLQKEQNQAPPVIRYIDETKEIAGYKCGKAEITINSVTDESGQPQPFTSFVYYTEEIPVNEYDLKMKGLKGYPMEYEMNQNGMKIKMTAKSVSKESIPNSAFDVPPGYKEMTKEELMKSMMGGGK